VAIKTLNRFVYGSAFATLLFLQVFEQTAFRIGKVSPNPSSQEESIGPMSVFLADQLGYQQVGMVYTKDIWDMVKKSERKEVDFFTGSLWEANGLGIFSQRLAR